LHKKLLFFFFHKKLPANYQTNTNKNKAIRHIKRRVMPIIIIKIKEMVVSNLAVVVNLL
jgi:hypothetical protein